MNGLNARRALTVGVTGAALALIPGTALAYWTAGGTGTGSAVDVATFDSPAEVTAVAIPDGRVTVSWSRVEAPGNEKLTGYLVARSSGTDENGTPVCATDPKNPETFLTGALSCVDQPKLAGTFTYVVTAVFRSWTSTTTSNTVVLTGPAQPAPATSTAGTPTPAETASTVAPAATPTPAPTASTVAPAATPSPEATASPARPSSME